LQTEVDRQASEMRRQFDALREAERKVEREQTMTAERARLTRDLHDGLGLHLNAALRLAQGSTPPNAALEATLRDALDDLRIAVDSLGDDERNPAAVLGTLRYRLGPRLAAAGIELAWRVDGDVPELDWLDSTHALHLLRLAQEAINNAVQHSGGKRVLVALAREPLGVRVQVEDDGANPFAAAAEDTTTARGRGLANMRSRAAALGGALQISTTAQGHAVTWWLPLQRT
jgi:signal transduction histidine kinase